MIENYVVYHLHSDLSNGVTNVDSVTKFQDYVDAAKECGMKAMAFSEHGSVFEWWHKKCAIEAAGMLYIHAAEVYLTETLEEKVRDNYHCVLLARNYEGFLELNRLISTSFNRQDNHFYYVPRISFDELFATSDDILITTACVGGVLGKAEENVQAQFLEFLKANRHRCFLEIGHHPDQKQVEYNQYLYHLSQQLGIPLIAGTDTHALNEEHERGRSILQKAKNIYFDGEDQWDLKFKSYAQLVDAFQRQGSLPEQVYLEAIANTNYLADQIEPFTIDCGTKYPHIYENPEETFRQKIEAAMESHPYAPKNHSREELEKVVNEEFEVYKKTGSIDFMLLQTYLREWEKTQGIQCGFGRGSVSGSMIAYLLGITQTDSIRFDLNFFRFMNPDRVSNADIDTDYSGEDRDRVKQFLLRDKMNLSEIRSAEIITFNTIALKGAVRDVCRALYKDREDLNYLKLSDEINSTAESSEELARQKYPEVFQYVDIVNGTIVSVGTHPSGVLVCDLPIDSLIGTCSVATSDYPVSMLNMKELDDQMFVKLDILGLDNLGIINDTCKYLGIDQMTPDNTDFEDMDVWRSIRDDTTCIFQWEKESGRRFIKTFMSDRTLAIAREKTPNFSMLNWMSVGNGLLRPSCASFRNAVAEGKFYSNGFKELDDFLAPEAGRIVFQETIMKFLVNFCGYSAAESDTVRRAIAKKKGTETLLPEIKQRFIEYSSQHYDITEERCAEVIEPFLQIILDASEYSFSANHSCPYSAIGYICGYLRYYHPLEFLTAALNIFGDNTEKTTDLMRYASKVKIKVVSPKWGFSKSDYFFDRETNTISKGVASIKFMSATVADALYEMSQRKHYDYFCDLLLDIDGGAENPKVADSRQVESLIKIDYFSDFGNQRELLAIYDFCSKFKFGAAKKMKKSIVDGTRIEAIVKRHATGKTKTGAEAAQYTLLDVPAILRECEQEVLSTGMEDLGVLLKYRNFQDIMGYAGYVSGLETDRNKLYIKQIFPVRRKKDNAIFAYNFLTQSVGSGIESRMTVFKTRYEMDPVKPDDIIICKHWERDRGYFRITDYERLVY